MRCRLNSSTFRVFEPVFIKIFIFRTNSFNFDQTYIEYKYRAKNSKFGRVKPRTDIP